jgi:hypothetical protein
MKYIILAIIGFLIYILYKRNQTVNNDAQVHPQVPEEIKEMQTPQELTEDEKDLIQHNQNVMTQINDYIKLSDTKNYSHDNIALGTANLMDYHDMY